MREIKFRAWDKINKKMEEVDGYNLYIADGRMFEIYEASYAYYETYMRKDDVTDKYILMQYTGLKDKNGKEIYEGDILDVDGTPWLVEPIGTEERDGGKFGLCASPYGSGEAYFIDKSILDGKVIGNIYESPELLKGEESE